MRADIHDGSEHNTLQSEAGYIDARPHVRQIDETLLQRTAGPYIGVIFVRSTRSRRSRHVRFAPIASEPSHRSDSTRCAMSSPAPGLHRAKHAMFASHAVWSSSWGKHMRRRDFITLLGGATAAGSVTIPAMAQQPGKVPRVGILTPAENDATPIFDAFRKGLRDLGYVDGKTIVLDFRFAKGNIDALTGLAAELVRIPVDVIVADATPATRAAFDATRTIPIVIGAAGDPVHLGFVASIRRPGGNVTGMTIRGEALSSRRV